MRTEKYSAEGNAQCAICWAPRISEENCSCKKPILLARNEEVSGYLHSQVSRISKGKKKYRHLVGMLQPFIITEWKWEVVTIDFITKMPKIMKQYDFITCLECI
jgi:hypothetical protein